MPTLSSELLDEVICIARRAGDAALEVYASDFDVSSKSDATPLTRADEQAETLIVAALTSLTPGVPIVCEEAVARGNVPQVGERFWLVDPLDGTKEFVNRNDEFTVNIALIERGKPSLGVVLAPALGPLLAGVAGRGAFTEQNGRRHRVACRQPPAEGLTVVVSRSHGESTALQAFLGTRQVAALIAVRSSLKFCMIACGEADLYPRLGATSEWDTAAGHAVVHAAGGRVVTLAGCELGYGKQRFANPPFVATGTGSDSAPAP